MDVAELCMGCMEPRGAGDTCEHCGYREGTEPDSPLHLHPRTELHGQYLIGKVLGHGGFGITYLGWDLNLARKIAIKEYLPSGVAVRTGANSEVIPFSGDSRKDFEYGLERYLDEARTVARFQTHPSVVSVLNFFRANGTAYLVMEYLEGTTFERYLDSHGGKTTVDTILTIMAPVLEALGSVHQQGILHRDISPDNIYITRKWQIKVLDFGAARYALGQKSRNLSVILKEGYAPVEQYHSKGNQGPWTDVYACGATIYRALTGKIPPASLDRMQGDDLRPPGEMGVEIAPQQERAILKALAVQPDARFHSMREFHDTLTGVTLMPVDEPAVEARPARRMEPSSERIVLAGEQSAVAEKREGSSRETPRTRTPQKAPAPKWLWAAAAGMLIAFTGVAGYRQWDDNRKQIEAQKQREMAKARFEEEMKQQEALRQETERRRLEREKEEALLKQQQEALDQKQRELAERESQIEQQRLRAQQQKAPAQPAQGQTQPRQNGNPYEQLNNNLRLRQQQMQQQLQQQLQQQAPRPQQQQFAPPTPTYDDLMRQAYGFSRARNYQASIQASQAAVRVNPNRPEAYANIGWVALYGSGDLSTAMANYRESLRRGGTVWFRVYHDHLNMTFQQRCSGDLGIARDHVEFAAQDHAHNFRIPKSEIREIQGNRIPFRPVSGDFHVKSTDGRNFNFISATNAKPVRDMILQLAGTR
ncbi:MAG: protein kinase [Bryobacterales bacterium]|nr:protein kinase [Bryobacterales bacterium]